VATTTIIFAIIMLIIISSMACQISHYNAINMSLHIVWQWKGRVQIIIIFIPSVIAFE